MLCWPGLEAVSGEAGVSAASACRGEGEEAAAPGPIRRNTEEKMEELEGEPPLCVSGDQA